MHDHIDAAVREFMGDNASATELREMREALEDRLRRLRTEIDAHPEAREELRRKAEQVERQIRVLAEEEAVSGFVEESVRASVVDFSAPATGPDPHDVSAMPPWAAVDVDDIPEA